MFRMTRDWPALAAAIKAFRNRLRLTQPELAAAAKASVSTIQKLESGRGETYWPNDPPESLSRIEAAFGWEDGAAIAILEEGSEAPPLPERVRRRSAQQAGEVAPAALPKEMPLHVKSELAGDRAVVQATVVQGPGDTRFAIVWTAGADADPSELTPEALEQWTRLNRAALGLPSGEDKPDG